MPHDQWMQWIAEQLMGIRGKLGEIEGRLRALETRKGGGPSLVWLGAVPWKLVASLILATALLISGHLSVGELKALLGLTRGD